MRWVDTFLTNIPFVGDSGVDRFTDDGGWSTVTHDGSSWTWDSWDGVWVPSNDIFLVDGAMNFLTDWAGNYLTVQ